MPVKIEPEIVEELRDIGLAIWEAKYYKQPFFNEKTGKMSQRENKNWVIVTLAGPGVDQVSSSGKTLRIAVDNLIARHFADRVNGLRGAMLRLEGELWNLFMACMETKYAIDPESLDDVIPF